jgi:hypothetical protein
MDGSSSIYSQIRSVQSLPPSFFTVPENYHVFYDTCYKIVPISMLRKSVMHDPSQILTLLLQRNMALFATRLPQAWLLRFLIALKAPSLMSSFDPEHIRTLQFDLGDTVAGVYRVVVRTPTKVEFDMWVPPQSGIDLPPIEGRLVFNVDFRDGDGAGDDEPEVEFTTLTMQWRLSEQVGIVLPLERKVLKWLHQLASWWLLESGVAWLSESGTDMCKLD